jgi:transcriptional regulator with XRE-family HTH domain
MKSTGSETVGFRPPINFTFMADTEPALPAGPMTVRLKSRGDKTALCKKLGISPQTLSNWIKRGVPEGRIARLSAILGISVERYYFEAGKPLQGAGRKQGELDSPMLVSDFEALPAVLRAVIARQARELREMFDTVPEHLRPLFTSQPPADPERYREWEKSIEALLAQHSKKKPDPQA